MPTYALHLPSLLPAFTLPSTLCTSARWLAVRLAFGGWLNLAAGEEGEPGALEGGVVGVGDSGSEIWALVCGDG